MAYHIFFAASAIGASQLLHRHIANCGQLKLAYEMRVVSVSVTLTIHTRTLNFTPESKAKMLANICL